MIFGEGLVKILQLIINAIIARKLSVTEFGLINEIFTISQILAIFTDFGMSIVLVRDISNKTITPKEVFKNFSQFKIVTILFIFLLTVAFSKNSNTTAFIYIALFNILQYGLLPYLYTLYRGEKNFIFENLVKLLSIVGFLIGLFIFYNNSSVSTAGFPYFLSALIPTIITIYISLKNFGIPKLNYQITNLYSQLKYFSQVGINQALNTFSNVAASQFIIIFSNNYLLGIFSAAYKLILPLVLFSSLINTVLLPNISRKGSCLNFNKKHYFLFISLVMVYFLIMLIFSNQIITFIYGEKYLDSSSVLRILSIYPVLQFVSVYLANVLIVRNQEKYVTKTTLISLLIQIILFLISYQLGKSGISLTCISLSMVISALIQVILRAIRVKRPISEVLKHTSDTQRIF